MRKIRINLARVLQIFPAVILLAAGFLKCHQLSTSPYAEDLVLNSRLLASALMVAEISLGVWLLGSWRKQLANCVAQVVFFLFLISSLARLIDGEASCGCFGEIKVHPFITLLFNTFALCCLSKTRESENTAATMGLISVLLIVIVLNSVCLRFVLAFQPDVLESVGDVASSSKVVVLRPSRWNGKELPIFPFLEKPDNRLLSGEWKIIIYSDGCEKCHGIVSEEWRPGQINTAYIAIPPAKELGRSKSEHVIWLELQNRTKWYAELPIIFYLKDGIVL